MKNIYLQMQSVLLSCLVFIVTISYVVAGTVKYTYDGAGRLTEADYGDKVIAFKYDKAGNILEKNIAEGTNTVRYEYDDTGRLTEADYGDKVITFKYDKAGNLLERKIAINKMRTDN